MLTRIMAFIISYFLYSDTYALSNFDLPRGLGCFQITVNDYNKQENRWRLEYLNHCDHQVTLIITTTKGMQVDHLGPDRSSRQICSVSLCGYLRKIEAVDR
jgi:hypothetical protein